MLYVGLVTDSVQTRMYVSSVSIEHDTFENNATLIDFSSPAAKRGDEIARSAELGILRNVLSNGGALVTIES